MADGLTNVVKEKKKEEGPGDGRITRRQGRERSELLTLLLIVNDLNV